MYSERYIYIRRKTSVALLLKTMSKMVVGKLSHCVGTFFFSSLGNDTTSFAHITP